MVSSTKEEQEEQIERIVETMPQQLTKRCAVLPCMRSRRASKEEAAAAVAREKGRQAGRLLHPLQRDDDESALLRRTYAPVPSLRVRSDELSLVLWLIRAACYI